MGYEIKFYAHGVPNGRKSWGVEASDNRYIETFYGNCTKSNVPAQMLVEIRKTGTAASSFYTYYCGQNVAAADGRDGSYVGLTLRISQHYYADIQNIYNLLDAAYNKYFVGTIVDVSGGNTKYKVADFAMKNQTLTDLTKELSNYLHQFSLDADFVPLTGFLTNGQGEPTPVNPMGYDCKTLENHVRKYGIISVSPHYPSKREQDILKKAEADKNALLDKYSNSDKTISTLTQEKEQALNDKKNLADMVQQLQNALKAQNDYDTVKADLKRKDEILKNIQTHLNGIQPHRITPKKPIYAPEETKKPIEDESNPIMELIQKIHPFVDMVVMLILVALVCFTLPKSCEQSGNQLPEWIAGGGYSAGGTTAETDTTKDSPDSLTDTQVSWRDTYPEARIDIDGISATNPMTTRVGYYKISLLNAEGSPYGEWKSNDFEVSSGGEIKPKHTGDCTIAYVIDGDTLISRIINVVE